MNPWLSLQKHLHNGPILVPCTEPEEAGCGLGCSPRLWSGTAKSSADVQHLPPPLLGSCISILQLCKRLMSKRAQNGCLYPTFPSETSQICTNPLEQQRCDAGLFSTHGLQISWVHIAASRSHTDRVKNAPIWLSAGCNLSLSSFTVKALFLA